MRPAPTGASDSLGDYQTSPPGRIYTHVIFLFLTPRWLETLPYLVCFPGFSAHCPAQFKVKTTENGAHLQTFTFPKDLGPSFPGSLLCHLVSSVRGQEGVLVSVSRPRPHSHPQTRQLDVRTKLPDGWAHSTGPWALVPLATVAALDTFNQMLLCVPLSCSQWYCVCCELLHCSPALPNISFSTSSNTAACLSNRLPNLHSACTFAETAKKLMFKWECRLTPRWGDWYITAMPFGSVYSS